VTVITGWRGGGLPGVGWGLTGTLFAAVIPVAFTRPGTRRGTILRTARQRPPRPAARDPFHHLLGLCRHHAHSRPRRAPRHDRRRPAPYLTVVFTIA
jgi:hypothetical protein